MQHHFYLYRSKIYQKKSLVCAFGLHHCADLPPLAGCVEDFHLQVSAPSRREITAALKQLCPTFKITSRAAVEGALGLLEGLSFLEHQRCRHVILSKLGLKPCFQKVARCLFISRSTGETPLPLPRHSG